MSITVFIPYGKSLYLTTPVSSTGTYARIRNPGDTGTGYGVFTVPANSTVAIGPFGEARQYLLTCENGEMTYVLGDGTAVPVLPEDNTVYFDGSGVFSTPAGGGGGSATDATITFSDITTNNSSTIKHGFLRKLDGNTSHYLNGDGQWTTPPITTSLAETDITFTDVTTNNATTSSHGYLPKLNNSSSQFLNGQGNWATPPATTTLAESAITFTDITTNNASTSNHGYLPKLTGSTTVFLNGNGAWTTPVVADGDYGDITVSSTGTVFTIDTPTSATVATDDKVIIKDTSASDATRYVTSQSIANLAVSNGTALGDADFSANGLMTRTASGTYTTRTITGTTSQITVVNGNGVSGNPTLSLPVLVEIGNSGTAEDGILVLRSGASGGVSLISNSSIDFADLVFQTSGVGGFIYSEGGVDVAVADGGTGVSSFTANAPIFGGGDTDQPLQSGTTGTEGQILTSSGSLAIPTWTTATFASTYSASTILYSNGANNVVGLATANNGVLRTNGSGVPSISTTLPNMAIGTPTSGTLTNCTGLPISTGVSGLGTGIATFLATPSSANLATAVTNETGSGSLVFATSPTLVTPTLGVASATSISFGDEAMSTYDEGTFTPALDFATTGNLSVSYTTQTGKYIRIGKLVYITIVIICTPTHTTASGQLRITGLPVAPNDSNSLPWTYKTSATSFNASDTSGHALLSNGLTYMRIQSAGSSTTVSDLTTANVTSGALSSFIITGTYRVA
jgi:hypothetical protein